MAAEHTPNPETRVILVNPRLTTPRAAAIAGIIFALLFTSALVLLHSSIPADIESGYATLEASSRQVGIALGLIPFAGIAFLWFIAVVRDRLGVHEDRFFATVFLGSGLLYLAMYLAAAAVVGGLLASFELRLETAAEDIYKFGRTITYQLMNVYAIRMAGVFMISTATMWVRTGVMPRPLGLVTYVLALILLLTISLSAWITLLFPAWVFTVSVLFLIANYRRRNAKDAEAADSQPANG